MTTLDKLFRKKLGIPYDRLITLENLDSIIEKAAQTIPFDNLSIIENRTNDITKENLIKKIINQSEGGLCYELNAIFHHFLIENDFNSYLIRAMRYDDNSQSWKTTLGKTHVTTLIYNNGRYYIIDIGFGGNSPLKVVPLNGETVTSANGEFKIESVNTEHGDSIFYMKLKNKDSNWKIGYAFDSQKPIRYLEELNDVQKINVEHTESNFNKYPLVTKFTDQGMITLTNSSFTKTINGEIEKEKVDEVSFHEIKKHYFNH
ncbi:arylamine N-acetyltransferase [Staphylococcus xylosus]|uniref:arylamine N-acetyltransferase family protein n=1 Tax=Staphylococcus xylosus TaxID=1288 RepID=UPI00203B413B|nr:arylamine N-acetyltransferase [Staphylococcus xylosus]MCM3519846.1 arylamine N-acetyltransferase [Staphylococcus xylosus]